MKTYIQLSFVLIFALVSFQLKANSFNSCPSKAFLMQDTVAKLYGVNLVTGETNILTENLGTSGKINAVGFNFFDNYIYGWGYEWGTVVKIGNDFQAQPLTISNLPASNFFVGDVALHENAYYFYKKGSTFGLYKASLDAQNNQYLSAQKIVDGASLNLTIFDLAFHPNNNFAYSVDKDGDLFKINVELGSAINLGNIGESGTFGAVYFDVNGHFYISRNQDGYIFRIDVENDNPVAEIFAYGPHSGNNDGARCAIAPIVDDSVPATIDFGDAPDSYGTTLDDNGARHGVSNELFLGYTIDAEYDAYVYPLSDESTGNDEDGVNFITAFESGLDSLIQVTVHGTGYLNIWVDLNQNGLFDHDEQLIYDRELSTGTHMILAETPLNVEPGITWARARYSSTSSIAPNGGVTDGEVEDYQVLVLNSGYTLLRNNPYFLAFEDNWPAKGDYDFNDVVIRLDSSMIITSDGYVKQLKLDGELKAMGASFHNGFAIQLEGIINSDIDIGMIRFDINGIPANVELLEEGTTHVVLKISDDLWKHVKAGGCWYFKTEDGCTSPSSFNFSIHIPFINDIPWAQFPSAPFNPFIFAAENEPHGDMFAESPGRELEIHLKNKPPTIFANTSYFGMQDDDSDVVAGYTYQTDNGLPWGIAINADDTENWLHPLEWVDISKAYPEFANYAISSGTENATWFQNNKAITSKIYSY